MYVHFYDSTKVLLNLFSVKIHVQQLTDFAIFHEATLQLTYCS